MEHFANDFQTTLASPIANGVTTAIAVVSGAGAPSANFRIRIDNEYLLVTSTGAGTNWTVQRGIEGSAAAAHLAGAVVAHVVTAGGLAQAMSESSPAGVMFAANNLSDVADVPTARANLGLGTAALLAASAVLLAANNLSDVNAATARSNLGLGSAALLASSAVLQVSNNLSDVGNVSTARTNLGLGSASTPTFAGVTVTGQLTSQVATGTAPLVVSSTTQVANLNASQLIGATWAAPGVIGSTTPAAGTFTGLTLTGGTVAVSSPLLSATQTWNDGTGATAFSAIKANITDTQSAAGSLLIDLQVASASKFSVRKDGAVTPAGAILLADGAAGTPSLAFAAVTGSGFFRRTGSLVALSIAGTAHYEFNTTTFQMDSGGSVCWSGGLIGAASDVILLRDAAGILAQRNGVNAQAQRIYNTFTDASNYERLEFVWSGNAATIQTTNLGTGTARQLNVLSASAILAFGANATATWRINSGSGSNFEPIADNGRDIGTSTQRVRNLYLGGAPVLKVKTGAIVDGDFTNPADGMIATDSTNLKIWVRLGGAWKSVVVA